MAKVLGRGYPVQRQRRLVRPGDRLVGVDDDYVLGQAGDDLLELGSVGALLRDAVGHCSLAVEHVDAKYPFRTFNKK